MCEDINGFSCVLSIQDRERGAASRVLKTKISLSNLRLLKHHRVSHAVLGLMATLLLRPPKGWGDSPEPPPAMLFLAGLLSGKD